MSDTQANLESFRSLLQSVHTEAESHFGNLQTLEDLEKFRIEFFGKKGRFSEIMRSLGQMSVEQKPEAGKLVNEIREKLFANLDARKADLEKSEWQNKLAKEAVDVTLPGRAYHAAVCHPVKIVEEEIVKVLSRCGFRVEIGPEVEHEFYNFDALNIPADHPSRTMQDTFYINKQKGLVLRTHTSPVQIRSMLQQKPPIRIIAPGRVYRSDYDATHTPMFHQIEGLLVDTDVNMGHLKGILSVMVKEMFGEDLSVRLRPSFFPFTEPSAEVDMQCCFCRGQGCSVCKHTGWIEIGGCGMVDPEVFKAVNINPEQYRGFAFGFGLERITMLRYGVNDLRSFFESDFRFISQFSRWRL